jgi:predicted metal-binding membrane protein
MDSAPAMALSMTAVMLPTAAPFFVAYTRDVKRPLPAAAVVAVYAAVWAAISLAAYLAMSRVRVPSTAVVAGAAITFAALYALTPWARRGAARCRQMCREPGTGALRTGLTYSGNCVLCSAGVMGALLVAGTSNIALMAAGSAVILVYKLAVR